MIEFLVDGAWCKPDFTVPQAQYVVTRSENFWRRLEWQALAFLTVTHPEHGRVDIAPKYYPWRIQ